MENCLKTKLKGSVDNENLPYYNAIPLYVKPSGSCTDFHIGDGTTPFVLVHPDGTRETVTGEFSSKFVANGEEQKFYLLPYLYSEDGLPVGGRTPAGTSNNTLVYIKAEDLRWSPARNIGTLSQWYSSPIAGNMGDIFKYSEPNPDVKAFCIRGGDFQLSGNEQDFKSLFSKIPNVELICWGYPSSWAYFNFSWLAEVTNCKLTNTFGADYRGDIYEYVQKARTLGITTGTIICGWFRVSNTCTVDGEAVTAEDTYGGIVWDASTIKIYGGNGNTIGQMTLKQTFNK